MSYEQDLEQVRLKKQMLVAQCLDANVERFAAPEQAASWVAMVQAGQQPTEADMWHIRRVLGMVTATLRAASAVASTDGPSLAQVFARVDEMGGATDTPASQRALCMLSDGAAPQDATALARAVHLYRSLREQGSLQGDELLWEMEAAIDTLPAQSALSRALHELAKEFLRADCEYLLLSEDEPVAVAGGAR